MPSKQRQQNQTYAGPHTEPWLEPARRSSTTACHASNSVQLPQTAQSARARARTHRPCMMVVLALCPTQRLEAALRCLRDELEWLA